MKKFHAFILTGVTVFVANMAQAQVQPRDWPPSQAVLDRLYKQESEAFKKIKKKADAERNAYKAVALSDAKQRRLAEECPECQITDPKKTEKPFDVAAYARAEHELYMANQAARDSIGMRPSLGQLDRRPAFDVDSITVNKMLRADTIGGKPPIPHSDRPTP